jgi:hypothetical protein
MADELVPRSSGGVTDAVIQGKRTGSMRSLPVHGIAGCWSLSAHPGARIIDWALEFDCDGGHEAGQ